MMIPFGWCSCRPDAMTTLTPPEPQNSGFVQSHHCTLQAVLPDAGEASPDGLDPTKPVSAATPPLVPPLEAAAAAGSTGSESGSAADTAAGTAGSGSPPATAPVSIPAGTSGEGHDGGGGARGGRGAGDGGLIGPLSGHVGMGSGTWLQGGGGGAEATGSPDQSRGKSPPQGGRSAQQSGSAGHASPTAASNPHRAPKSAFASWRPMWQVRPQSAGTAEMRVKAVRWDAVSFNAGSKKCILDALSVLQNLAISPLNAIC